MNVSFVIFDSTLKKLLTFNVPLTCENSIKVNQNFNAYFFRV